MNKISIKILGLIVSVILASVFYACKEDDTDNAPAPAKVSNPSYEKTYGGAVISYTLPEDENLAFVETSYVNSQNEKVFRVASRYLNQLEIDGFTDIQPYEVNLYSVGWNGKKSDPETITVIPDTSYIYIVQNNLKIESILGGVNVEWRNPAAKTVYVNLQFNDGTKEHNTFLSADGEYVSKKVRGLDSIPYDFSVSVEDFSNNKTTTVSKGVFTPKPEVKISKSTWQLVTNKSCDGDKYEGLMANLWDDVIDTKDSPDDNSYFLIHRDDNGGSLRFLSASEEKPLLIVIDMQKKAVVSRLAVWQRAYQYTSSDDGGISENYAFYKDDNLKSFYVYGSNDLNDITPANVWNNPLMICDIGTGRDEDGNFLPGKLQEALDGHEFELPEISEPFRYLVLGLTATFSSETQICCSEITLWGLDNQE